MNAPKAAVLAMLRHARTMTMNTGSHTARMGTLCLLSIFVLEVSSACIFGGWRGRCWTGCTYV